MSKQLILLIGNIGVGKSTVASILVKKFGFTEKTFAEPLKNFAISIGFDPHQVYGTQNQKLEINNFWGISGREFLQKFGTEICRNSLPLVIPDMKFNGLQIWARVMERHINENEKLVISDGRFEDEAQLVKKYGGIIIKICRNCNEEQKNSGMEKNISNHKSETELNGIKEDISINNNGTIEELEKKISSILNL